MRSLPFFMLVGLVSGCLCFGSPDLGDFGTSPGVTESTQPACSPPYIQVGVDCCLDRNDNGICDSDETPESTLPPSTTQTTHTTVTTSPQLPSTTYAPTTSATTIPSTTLQTTTTLAGGSCSDGVMNQDEEYADCGGSCTECLVFDLRNAWIEFKNTGYKFRYDKTEGSSSSRKYFIDILTPDGVRDNRPLSTGESFVDNLRFKVINYGDLEPKIYVRVNTEDLAKIPPHASLLTIGGQSCAQGGGEMCERVYAGYRIRNMVRIEGGAKVVIHTLDGVQMDPQEVTDSKKAFSVDHAIVVGGFFDRQHFIQGGYNLFYVYTL